MTDTPDVPVRQAVVRKRTGFQVIWLIPLVTVFIAGWLWYRAVQAQGPTIEIAFASADGLEAGKTAIKYKELKIGTVTSLRLDESLETVIATAELEADTERFLVDGTRFWVVLPRIDTEGISGLGTIVSGAYISAEIATSGAPTRSFRGLDEPPDRPLDAPGLRVKLTADSLGSVGSGSPVSHMQIPMGDVEGYRYLRDEERIEFDVYIEPEYADLVRTNTRFWNTSGLSLSLGAGGVDVQVDSLESLLSGGIAFGKAPGEDPGPRAEAGHVFELLDSRQQAMQIVADPRQSVVYFYEPIDGLAVGSPVTFQGLEIGEVVEVGVNVDPQTVEFSMPVVIETYAGRLNTHHAEEVSEPHEQRMQSLVDAGLRARLGPANLVTGARGVVVEFAPDTEVVLQGDSQHPEIPTLPSTGAALGEMLDQLPGIVANLSETVDALAQLASSDGTRATLDSLASATESLDALLADVRREAGPTLGSVEQTLADAGELMGRLDAVLAIVERDAPQLMASLTGTSDAARGVLEPAEVGVTGLVADMPALQDELLQVLHEIRGGMRGIAALADTLERHPEALLSGKPDTGGD